MSKAKAIGIVAWLIAWTIIGARHLLGGDPVAGYLAWIFCGVWLSADALMEMRNDRLNRLDERIKDAENVLNRIQVDPGSLKIALQRYARENGFGGKA